MKWDPLALQKLPPEIAEVVKPIIEQFEDSEEQILQRFLDRLDGAQIVTVSTIKFARAGASMAVPVQSS
jgi:hypothetical protein